MAFRTLEPIGDLPLTPPVGPDPEEHQCVVCKRWSYGRDMLDIDGEMICDDYDCLMELCRYMIADNNMLRLKIMRMRRGQ